MQEVNNQILMLHWLETVSDWTSTRSAFPARFLATLYLFSLDAHDPVHSSMVYSFDEFAVKVGKDIEFYNMGNLSLHHITQNRIERV